jgi:hypothetical protein
METKSWKPEPGAWLAAVGGPLALGAVLGLSGNLAARAAGVPAVVFGVAALMAPALYIAASLARIAPDPRAAAGASLRALRAGGLVMLGLAAPTAFVLATNPGVDAGPWLLGMAVTGAGALAAIRVLSSDLFPPRPVCSRCRREHTVRGAVFCTECGGPIVRRGAIRAVSVVAGWSLVTLAIGAQLLSNLLAARPS